MYKRQYMKHSWFDIPLYFQHEPYRFYSLFSERSHRSLRGWNSIFRWNAISDFDAFWKIYVTYTRMQEEKISTSDQLDVTRFHGWYFSVLLLLKIETCTKTDTKCTRVNFRICDAGELMISAIYNVKNTNIAAFDNTL